MNVRVLQLFADLGKEDLNLFLSPRLGHTMVSEQPHGPTLQSGVPVSKLKVTSLLQNLVLGPGPEGNLVLDFVDIDESGLLDCAAHRFVGSERSVSGSFGASNEHVAPSVELVAWLQAAVVAVNAHV